MIDKTWGVLKAGFFGLQLLLLMAGMGTGQNKADKVQELLAKARAALGGEARLQSLKTLSATAKFRRMMGNNEMGGEFQMDFLPPDRFLKTETLALPGGVEATMIDALNGAEFWRDTRTGPSMGGGQVMIRRPMPSDPQALSRQTQELRAEFVRNWLAFCAALPPGINATASYAGEAEAEDGKADVIDFKDGDLEFRFFLDSKSHLPVMISYKAAAPQVVMRTVTGPAPPSREQIERQAAEAAEHNRQQPQQAPKVEVQLSLSEHKAVNGIHFPHRVVRMTDGKVSEEWEMTGFKINPALKADAFQKK